MDVGAHLDLYDPHLPHSTDHARVATATATIGTAIADRCPVMIHRISVTDAYGTLAAALPSQKSPLRPHMSV